MVKAQAQHALALSMIKHIGTATSKKLTEKFGTTQQALDYVLNPQNPKFRAIRSSSTLEKDRLLSKASSLLEKHRRKNVAVIPYEDDYYPQRLKNTPNPPTVLYSSKYIDLNEHRLIAIVGTRQPTTYGKKFVEQLVASLKKYQPVIVSGLAYGIDMCAHRAALAHHMPTIAVVAGGIDMIYPYEHAKEVTAINQKGCVLSEYPLGTKPERHHFPTRNRIIAGMVDAVIVIEGSMKSGALITAKYANDFNTEVFALPGNINQAQAQGCHYLIKTHQAHMITCADDIAYMMNWDSQSEINKKPTKELSIPLDTTEKSIVKMMMGKSNPSHVEDLSRQVQLDVATVADVMLKLELKNCVTQADTNAYVLN